MASLPSHCFASKLCLPALARKLPTRSLTFFNPLASAKRLSCSPAKKLRFPVIVASASSLPSQIAPPPTSQVPTRSSLTDSTRTLKTLLSITLSASLLLVKAIQELGVRISQKIALNPGSRENLLSAAGPLFFASVRDQPSGYLNTPLTVVAAGLAKWLDIYSAVLMVRVLLSWFPNIPWDRQPLSAIRDLCDPYLNLFRNIIPPVFDTLDVSPLLAFAVLGVLGGILHNSKGV